ncbi:hypothetical protein [Nostocoides vanveenii]|uniref:Uncharacterized protein n=1 Tax=Nostocoides vanveenii TaxID=330835 RepID=A0ABP4WNZ6_9MICO
MQGIPPHPFPEVLIDETMGRERRGHDRTGRLDAIRDRYESRRCPLAQAQRLRSRLDQARGRFRSVQASQEHTQRPAEAHRIGDRNEVGRHSGDLGQEQRSRAGVES